MHRGNSVLLRPGMRVAVDPARHAAHGNVRRGESPPLHEPSTSAALSRRRLSAKRILSLRNLFFRCLMIWTREPAPARTLGVALHALGWQTKRGMSAVILGAGPIGLAHLQLARVQVSSGFVSEPPPGDGTSPAKLGGETIDPNKERSCR